MPRRVVLLTRDASLVVAVKALLDDDDWVSELESPQELPPAGELPADAVVVDLPGPARAASIERVRGRFSGPLVVLLGHGEDPATAGVTYRCSVLTRPFGMSQLWSLLVNPAAEAVTEIIPAVQRGGPSPAPPPDPSGSSPSRPVPAPASERPAAPMPGTHERPAAPMPGTHERPAAPAPGTHERPAAPVPGTHERPAAPAPGRPVRVSDQPELAPERHARLSERPSTPAPGRPPAAGERPAAAAAERPPAVAPERPPTVASQRPPAVAPERPSVPAPARAPAWSWRFRRFQQSPDADELTQPMPAVPPTGNGAVPAVDRAGRPPGPAAQAAAPVEPRREDPAPRAQGEAARPAPRAAAPDEVSPDPPEAVAGRLAERLRADTVVLLLDNNRGLLEVAGGVGLTAAERYLQVEYGHEVLLELFRVGVGLIEDTDRVRGLIQGIPGSRSQSLVMVPLVHEGHGFGALIIGRTSQPGEPRPEFTEPEIEALMDFAEDIAAPLRSTVLLRRLKGQLNTRDRT